MREQFDRNHAFFLALSEDSLLKPFRQKAGLPAPGEDMGGWYTFYADFSPKGTFPAISRATASDNILRAGACVCADRIEADTAEGASADRGIREDHHAKVLRRLSPARLHLRQDLLRPDRRAPVRARSDGDARIGPATDAVIPFLPGRALNRKEMSARPHKNDRLLLGRDLHPPRKSLSCLPAQR